MEMDQEDKEYFEDAVLKDQALRLVELQVESYPQTKSSYKIMRKNGMTHNEALASIMEMTAESLRGK